uniref:Polyprotein n=1 Tax=Cajanus cajan TaxID=3821 RepID=A0A151SWS7_CAJCA|nr:polyprotein [Cajanus cajan]
MSPSDLKLAKQECQELLRQGLIEQTTSNWACQAFYVEKRSERLRGKKRLVVDYKPLNHFLKDDKFPLPKTSTLPILLKESKIFSKFDLKSGFWQLGVDPSERHKTAFCIPNAQYQWTVLPFGLKVAPSLFQKAITKILEPLLDNAIIYIDDILSLMLGGLLGVAQGVLEAPFLLPRIDARSVDDKATLVMNVLTRMSRASIVLHQTPSTQPPFSSIPSSSTLKPCATFEELDPWSRRHLPCSSSHVHAS